MKVRNGFVSNSSSSSFIVTYDEIVSIENVDLHDGEYYALGDYLVEGLDYFKIDGEKWLETLTKIYYHNDFTIFKNPKCIAYDSDVLITNEMVGKYVTSFKKDYYCTERPEDLMHHYNYPFDKKREKRKK